MKRKIKFVKKSARAEKRNREIGSFFYARKRRKLRRKRKKRGRQGQMVAKTVMVYSRQVIMIGHLILKMQSMLMLTGANGMFIGIICKDITLRMKMECDRKENIYLMKLNTFIITNNSEIP
ncbi:hypothetical protein ACTGW6_00780 [Streptococcus suis]|nr:hypothetical protein [Streptococcus suis]NQN58902.1 hypothetical protein [Streptococcus suis]